MSLQNNNTMQNGKGGSGKIHPVPNETHSKSNHGQDTVRISLESGRISGRDKGGYGSNRQLLGEKYEISDQLSTQIQQPKHDTQSRSSFESQHNNIQQQRFTSNENPQKTIPSSLKVRQVNGVVDNRTEPISIMDHLETEQQLYTIHNDADQLLAKSEEMPLSFKDNAGKRIQKVEFNFDTTGSQEGLGSLGNGMTHSELPTQPGDDATGMSVKQRLQRKQTGKFIKRDKTNVPRRDSTKVLSSYITTVNGNSQLKNALSMKNNKGRRTSVIGSLGTLSYTMQITDAQNSQENSSTDSDLENLSQWQKVLHTISSSLHLTSVIPFNSKFRMYWDFVIISLGLWVCFTTPLDVAFEPQTFKLRGYVFFNEMIDILFILDIIFNFRTTISDFITGDEISDSKTIALKYLKGQFLIDIIAAIPMDLIMGVTAVGLDVNNTDSSAHRILYGSAAAASAQIPLNSTSSTNVDSHAVSSSFVSVEILNILSILKIIRVLRFTKIITFLNTSENVKLSLRLFKLIFYLMIYIHWQACAWFYYTKWDRMWLPLPDIIRQDYHFYDHGVAFTYCFSIWHSVSILDGDDMVPANAHQAIVVSVLVIISEFIHAHIIGTMDVVLHSLSSKSEHFQEKIEFVTTTMKSIRLDQEVQQKVLKYVSKVHSQMDQRKHLNKMMESLSPSLQHLITRHMFMNIIQDHAAFKSLPELFEFLVESIEAIQYMPEQYIFKEGQKATHLYILEDGSCEVLVKGTVLKKEIYVRDIEPGNIFGEVALINGLRRTASVRSKVHCTVGAISDENFEELIRYFPEVKNRMKEQCRKYNDHWKDYQINVLANIHYLRNVPYNVREDLHYKLSIENFEAGAKLFNRGQECETIMIVVNGQVELFVEQREQEYILDTIGIGSTIGAYSVLNNCHYEYTGRAKNKVSCLILQRQDLLDSAEQDPLMTEALDGATQYIVHNEVPLCDYSTLNNKDPIDTHAYVDQIDDAVTPIERFRRAIEKVMVLNRRNEVKLSKLFATIRRLKEERDQKANILGQVSSGIINPENETLGQKLRRGIQNALQNLQKGETKAESETLMTSLKAQFQEQDNLNGGNIKGVGVGVGVPMKEFTRLMYMMENLHHDMKLVKQALNIPETSHRRKESMDQDHGSNYFRDNSHRDFSSSKHSKFKKDQSPKKSAEQTFQDQMESLNREQAALPVKKNIIALLINAKIELQKEKILKEQQEAAAAALAQEEGLKIENANKPITKRKSEQSLIKGSLKNNQDINRVQSLQIQQFKNENQQSPQSNISRQVSHEQKHSKQINSFVHNSKAGSGSSNNLGKQSDKGPLEELSVNESAVHLGLNNENSPQTRASSVLRRRDPFNNQKHNLNGNINQLEIDDKKSRNFMASEAYSNNFDVPQISKDRSPDIHRHFTMADENFQDVMTVPVPNSNIDRTYYRNKEDSDLKQQPMKDTVLVPPIEKEQAQIEAPNFQIQSSPIQKNEKAVPTKEELLKKEPLKDQQIVFTNEQNDRKSLDQNESIQDVQEEEKEESANQIIKESLKANQEPSRNSYLNNPTSGNDLLFKPTGISLTSIELMNKSNTANAEENQSTTNLMIVDNAKHYQSSLHQQRSNFLFGAGSVATTVTPPNISSNLLMLDQAGSLVELVEKNRNAKNGKIKGDGTNKSRNSSQVISQFASLGASGVGSKNLKNNQKSSKRGQKQNPSMKNNSELSSDTNPINQQNNEGNETGLLAYNANPLGRHRASVLKKPNEININSTEGTLQYISKVTRSPSPPVIPTIIESKVPLNPNQLLHPKGRAEAGQNPYLGNLPVPKAYTGSISPNEKSNRSQGASASRLKGQGSNRRRRDISGSRDQELNQQTNNAQEDYEGGIDDMIEQEIARIHGLSSAKTANMVVGAASAEETEMVVSYNTNSKKNYKKTGAASTANNSTNQQNKQNNR